MNKILFTRKNNVKKVLSKSEGKPKGRIKESALQAFIVKQLEEMDVSQGSFGKATKSSRGRYMTYRHMTSIMKLDVVDKILASWPEMKIALAHHLMGDKPENNSGNITHSDINAMKVEKEDKELQKRIETKDKTISGLLDAIEYNKSRIKKLNEKISKLEEENKRLKQSAATPDNSKV